MFKWCAGVVAVAMALAVATAFSGAARDTVVPEAVAIKGDRLDIRPVSSGCPKIEWPYGCQWNAPVSRRAERPLPATATSKRLVRNRFAASARVRRLAAARGALAQDTTR
jgi:hypothetical protein